ncbi:hypothetical protein [Agrobacterium rosae]|uniref:Uncharacterized protein n=1 Tax=Agrobacterium rosae TaxID=1972867 RepID=A0A1R3TTC4_9HYPH|nr:hypothetical protein [Agrobacterium rosae]MBN7805608.1 hypothetical protein [Agrobacterium rosae]MDX8301915.1 hypothetical protein [Agrobacterium rosae]MDX8313473.1 hypothetical protein [Agrobacterium rosae]SCX25834.1 hypothetical protein DSM25559_2754 [Agrobacterium rosae]
MAYDWSGNTVKEKHDDWTVVVMVAVVALVLLVTIAPLRLIKAASPQHVIETSAVEIRPA